MSTCSSALSESFSRSERCYFSKNNINPYLLIITVLIISTSFVGTEVKLTGTKFIVNVIYHHTWSLFFFFNSSYTCWTWYTFTLIKKKPDTGDSWLTVIHISTILRRFLRRLAWYHLSLSVCSCSLSPKHLLQSSYKSSIRMAPVFDTVSNRRQMLLQRLHLVFLLWPSSLSWILLYLNHLLLTSPSRSWQESIFNALQIVIIVRFSVSSEFQLCFYFPPVFNLCSICPSSCGQIRLPVLTASFMLLFNHVLGSSFLLSAPYL